MECSTFSSISFSVLADVVDGGVVENAEEVCLVMDNVGVVIVRMVMVAGVVGVWIVVVCWAVV